MNQNGSAIAKIIIAIVLLMVGGVLVFLGQIGIAIVAVALVLIVAGAILWSRARTPTDIR